MGDKKTQVQLKRERLAGLRFAQLIRQLEDNGWTYSRIADAIGCSVSLISKTVLLLSDLSDGVVQKGLRDDLFQGVYDGLGVRLDYFVMPTPKGSSNQIRLKSGQTRPADKHELDINDFRVVTNAEFEAARDRKERTAFRNDLETLGKRFDAAEARESARDEKMDMILALLGAENRSTSVK